MAVLNNGFRSHLDGFLFFNYHNDARSNKHQNQNYVW